MEPTWLVAGDVLGWFNKAQGAAGVPDPATVARVCASVEPYVESCRPEFPVTPTEEAPATYKPDAEVYQAAVMLAARVLRRRNSVGGTETFGNDGVFAYVARQDPEIERALRTGAYQRPAVG